MTMPRATPRLAPVRSPTAVWAVTAVLGALLIGCGPAPAPETVPPPPAPDPGLSRVVVGAGDSVGAIPVTGADAGGPTFPRVQ